MNKKIIVALCFALSFLLVIPIFTVYAASQTADFESTGYSHLDAIDTAEGFVFETYEPDNTIKVSGALFYSQFGYNNSPCVSPYSFNDGRPTPYQFRIKRQDGSNFSLSSIFLFADGYGCQYSNMRGYRDGSMVYEQTNIDMDSGVAVSGLNWINIDEIRIFQVDADPEGLAMAVDNIVFDLSVDTTAPTQQALSTVTLNEGTSATISSTYLSFADNIDPASDVTYTVTDLPDNGSVKNNSSTLSLNGTFTQADINNNLVTYAHDDSNTTSDSFGFKVADSSGNEATGKTFSFTVNAIDDDVPTVETNAGLTVDEGGSGTIDISRLAANDADSANSSLVYTVTMAPSSGAVKKSGSAVGQNETFTQGDITNNLITYSHNGLNTTSDSFMFKVSDGGGNSITNQTFSISVNAVDDTAPTIATNTGLTLDEGATATIGISKLEADDEDTANSTLIYTITYATVNGRVENSDSAGTPVTSFTQQNLIDNKIRYVHNGGDTTSDSFGFSVSDGSGNSLTGQVFSIAVTAVDDTAPVITANSNLLVMKSDSALLASKLVSTDTETDNSTIEYTVTTPPSSGTLSLSSFTQAQLDAGSVTYTHGGDSALSDSFIFTVADTNGNEVTGQTFNITITELPTPTPSPTPSPTPTPTAAPTATPAPTRNRTTYSPSITPAPSATPDASQETDMAETTPTQTLTPTPIVTPTLVPQAAEAGLTKRMITGVILDGGGKPMAGYIVELHSDPKTAVTDEDGHYSFYDVEYTSHTLIVKTSEGYEVASFEIEFEQGEYFESEKTPQGAKIVYSETVTWVDIELELSDEGDSASIVKVENETETQPEDIAPKANYLWLWIIVILLSAFVVILIMRLISKNKKKSRSRR